MASKSTLIAKETLSLISVLNMTLAFVIQHKLARLKQFFCTNLPLKKPILNFTFTLLYSLHTLLYICTTLAQLIDLSP